MTKILALLPSHICRRCNEKGFWTARGCVLVHSGPISLLCWASKGNSGWKGAGCRDSCERVQVTECFVLGKKMIQVPWKSWHDCDLQIILRR